MGNAGFYISWTGKVNIRDVFSKMFLLQTLKLCRPSLTTLNTKKNIVLKCKIHTTSFIWKLSACFAILKKIKEQKTQ